MEWGKFHKVSLLHEELQQINGCWGVGNAFSLGTSSLIYTVTSIQTYRGAYEKQKKKKDSVGAMCVFMCIAIIILKWS